MQSGSTNKMPEVEARRQETKSKTLKAARLDRRLMLLKFSKKNPATSPAGSEI